MDEEKLLEAMNTIKEICSEMTYLVEVVDDFDVYNDGAIHNALS